MSFFWSSAEFSSKITFSNNSLGNAFRVSNGLHPDWDQHSVGPDLGPNHFNKDYQQMTKVNLLNLLK